MNQVPGNQPLGTGVNSGLQGNPLTTGIQQGMTQPLATGINSGLQGNPLTTGIQQGMTQPLATGVNPGLHGNPLTTGIQQLVNQPLGSGVNPGLQGNPLTTGIQQGMGQPLVTGANPILQGAPLTTGIQQAPVSTYIEQVPVDKLPHGLHPVQGGPSNLAQTKPTGGQFVGTVPHQGGHGAALATTGIAGESMALAQNVGNQGNVTHGPIGTISGLTQTNVTPTHSVPGNTTAQGSFTFRPLEGRFVRDKDPITKMDPYVKIKLGWHRAKTAVAQGQGTNPVWNDAITLPRKHNETFAKLKIKDKDRVSRNDRLGEVRINLDEVVQRGKFSQWYPVTDLKGNPSGEILVETEWAPLFIK